MLLRRLIAAFTIVFLSCSDLFGQSLIAHRGASHDAPENTLAAFRLAWKQGADGVEGDFYLTKDGQIVCIHDRDTGRTGDKELVVADSTLAQLRQVDVGSWKGRVFAGERIPTLAEVLADLPGDKTIFIEIKCGPEIVPALAKEIESSKRDTKQITVISFNAQVIHDVRKRLPNTKAYWLTGFSRKDSPTWKPSLNEVLGTLRKINATGVDAEGNLECLTESWISELTAAGFELHCYTINDEKRALKLRSLGAKSITTDRPAFLRKCLSAK